MEEISCEQYRNILKSIDDDSDFEYAISETLTSNLKTDSLNILNTITILDAFLILLQLKVLSCGEELKLMRVCDKCGQKSDFNINLNNLLDNLAKDLDRSHSMKFEKRYQKNNNNVTIECDIPSFRHFTEMRDFRSNQKDNENYLSLFTSTFIKSVANHSLADCSLSDLFKIAQNIPYSVMLDINQYYITKLSNIFKKLLFVKSVCKNQFCKDELEIKMDISNMTDLMRILFKDSSATDMLSKYANVSMNCHFDYKMYDTLTPIELNHINEMINQSNKQQETASSNKDINLFEEYRLQTEGMVESPSEFK
jgi:hypothetical protein